MAIKAGGRGFTSQFFTSLESNLSAANLVPSAFYNVIPDVEPDWYSGNLHDYPCATYPPRPRDKIPIYQQNELLYPVLNDVAMNGLKYVYEAYTLQRQPQEPIKDKTTSNPRTIVIVGAGMAGLSAAYELKKAGHEVIILETQNRVGGRIKTFGEKHGFTKTLYADAGAMRLPNKVDAPVKYHYLTDHYINELGLTSSLKPFNNEDKNAFVKFYDMPAIRLKEWTDNEYSYTNKFWPGWDKKFNTPELEKKLKKRHIQPWPIKGINDYYDATMGVIKKLLTTRLDKATSNAEAAVIWEEWIYNWSRFSLVGFLRSNIDIIKATLQTAPDITRKSGDEIDYQSSSMQKSYWDEISNEINQSPLEYLLNWPEEAITAYATINYTEQLDQSLVQYLRDELGGWWSPDMHHIDGGMAKLPEKFLYNEMQPLESYVTYNFTVSTITYGEKGKVSVEGYNAKSGQILPAVEGNAVIITTPLHAIRQIKFNHTGTEPQDSQFPCKFYKAVENIWYGPSTKIMIQSKTKFWAKTSMKEKDKICGGFSKTNSPIGQIHYPTLESTEESVVNSPGILLCYMWKAEALLFGALHPQVAIRQAVREIAQIHPEIEEQFQVGAIHAWYNDPAAQGAYTLLKPNQYRAVHYLMINPYKNVFFAGEGISHCTGWIQGALESGLRAAYQFYLRNEKDEI